MFHLKPESKKIYPGSQFHMEATEKILANVTLNTGNSTLFMGWWKSEMFEYFMVHQYHGIIYICGCSVYTFEYFVGHQYHGIVYICGSSMYIDYQNFAGSLGHHFVVNCFIALQCEISY